MLRYQSLCLAPLLGFGSVSAFAASALDGDWQRPCWRGDLDLSVEEETAFANDSFTILRRFSAQETCDRADFQFMAKGEVITHDSPVVLGALNVDVTWNSAVAVTLHEEATRAFNQMEACGFTDWQTNVPKDIGGRQCETMRAPAAGQTYYLLFKVEGDTYYPGDINAPQQDGLAEDRRPRTLAQYATSVRRSH